MPKWYRYVMRELARLEGFYVHVRVNGKEAMDEGVRRKRGSTEKVEKRPQATR